MTIFYPKKDNLQEYYEGYPNAQILLLKGIHSAKVRLRGCGNYHIFRMLTEKPEYNFIIIYIYL